MPFEEFPALTLIGAEVRYESLRTTLIVTDVSSKVVAESAIAIISGVISLASML